MCVCRTRSLSFRSASVFVSFSDSVLFIESSCFCSNAISALYLCCVCVCACVCVCVSVCLCVCVRTRALYLCVCARVNVVLCVCVRVCGRARERMCGWVRARPLAPV